MVKPLVVGLLVWFTMILLFFSVVPLGSVVAEKRPSELFCQEQSKILRAYVPHGPINIVNDSDFDAQFPSRTIGGLDITTGGKMASCIYIDNCSRSFRIEKNYIHGSMFYGIKITWSKYFVISDNIIESNADSGMFILGCSRNHIANNTCTKNKNGINTEHFNTYTNFVNNTLVENNAAGLLLGSKSNRNYVASNNVSKNKIYGIEISASNNNNVTHNLISHNQYGIYLVGVKVDGKALENEFSYNNITSNSNYGAISIKWAENNTFHHNNFIANNGAGASFDPAHAQANSTGGINYWNTSTCGNYWSDWTGPDTTPKDGFVDFPYPVLSSTTQDKLPLAEPVLDSGIHVSENGFSGLPFIVFAVVLALFFIIFPKSKVRSWRLSRRF